MQWTQDERNMLRRYYYTRPENCLLAMFPGRSMNAIRKQVQYLRKRGWVFDKK